MKPKCFKRARFLNLSTIDILDQIILCCEGDWPYVSLISTHKMLTVPPEMVTIKIIPKHY